MKYLAGFVVWIWQVTVLGAWVVGFILPKLRGDF